jgi:hypothetical protein
MNFSQTRYHFQPDSGTKTTYKAKADFYVIGIVLIYLAVHAMRVNFAPTYHLSWQVFDTMSSEYGL